MCLSKFPAGCILGASGWWAWTGSLITGKCSIEADTYDNQLEVICKTGPETYKKHFLGLSDNVAYFVEQLESSEHSAYHYRVTFKPQAIIPDIDFRGSTTDLPRTQD